MKPVTNVIEEVFKAYQESILSDITAASISVEDDGPSEWNIHGICMFCFAIEKLLKLALYLNSPYLLKKDKKQTELVLNIILGEKDFGTLNWISKIKPEYQINLNDAWDIAVKLNSKLDSLTSKKSMLFKARNAHIHGIYKHPSPVTRFSMNRGCWDIINHLSDFITNLTNEIDVSIDLGINDFYYENIDGVIFNGNSESDIQKLNLTEENLKLLKEGKSMVEIAAINNVEIGDDLFEEQCPNCGNEGKVGFNIDEFEFDEHGISNEIVGIIATWSSFSCEHCGICVDSPDAIELLSEVLGVKFSIQNLKPSYLEIQSECDRNAVGEVENCSYSYKVAEFDKKGYSDGLPVIWN